MSKQYPVTKVPRHLAIIMDGNRRWAKQNFLKKKLGHYEGAERLKNILEISSKLKIEYLTVYAFSTENWYRDADEVSELMQLLEHFLDKERDSLIKQKIRLRVLGDIEDLQTHLQDKLQDVILATKDFTEFNLNIALNYGSREEIINAIKKIPTEEIKNLDEKKFSAYLYTNTIPDPDLIIRTGGELRLSNFLLWQAAYAELYFTEKLWPEFKEAEFYQAISAFGSRDRRYGLG